MIENYLIQPFPGCSPEAKYLALKIVALYGEQLPRQLRIEDVSIAATLPRARTSTLMSELVNHGVLAVEKRSDGPGRPKKIYDFSADFKRQTPELPAPCPPLKKAVTSLFETNRGELNEDINSEFAASTVLLLAFLLAKANSTGAVRNLSATEIQKKTGLNAKRQRAHLRRLKNAGFLLHKVQGTVASNLLGKANSSYWLNLHHVFFQSVSNMVSPKTKIVQLEHWLLVHTLLSNRDQNTYARKIEEAINSFQRFFASKFSEKLLETIRTGPITDNQLSPLLDTEDLDTHQSYLCTCEELAEQLIKSTLPAQPHTLTKRQQLNLCRQLYQRLIPRKNWPGKSSENKGQRKLLVEFHMHLVQGIACDLHRALKSEIKSKTLNELTIVPMGQRLGGSRSVFLLIK